MKKLIIFGATIFSQLIKTTIEEDHQGPVEAFCVNKAYLEQARTEFPQEKIVAFEELEELYGKDGFEVLITVGYKKMNTGRQRVFAECDARGYPIASFVHSTAECKNAKLGRGNIVFGGCKLHPYSSVGDGNILINDTVIGHHSTVGDFNFFATATTGGLAHIGSNCFFGMRCIVGNECAVGDYCLIGTGVVCVKSCEPGTLVMPAANRTKHLGVDMMLKGDLL